MTRTTYNKIPFNIELAKKITNKEAKGRIVNVDGNKARIICWNKDCGNSNYPIIALVDMNGGEQIFTFTKEGKECIGFNSYKDLCLEVPTYYRDYSNFKPCKWQQCLVRDVDDERWNVVVCAGKNTDGDVVFYGNGLQKFAWGQVLPLSKVTERLVGTTMSYEQLIQELDKNGQD
jgi:hypothetical protein|nr:MAG TPA: hypothetical protein [Caudoviricetes sp.]